jgi:ribosomal protein S18 acetylase RimI-like enzyme
MVFWYVNALFVPDQPFHQNSGPHGGRGLAMSKSDGHGKPAAELRVRPVEAADLGQVIAIDTEVTGLDKTDYWYELFHRYGGGRTRQRLFLVAESGNTIEGFIIGEVRDWEFGSAPCGWVFGLSVRASARLAGVGARMLDAICDGFRHAGVNKVRTLLARDNGLVLSFFRSQGMMAAPYIPLEKDLD